MEIIVPDLSFMRAARRLMGRDPDRPSPNYAGAFKGITGGLPLASIIIDRKNILYGGIYTKNKIGGVRVAPPVAKRS